MAELVWDRGERPYGSTLHERNELLTEALMELGNKIAAVVELCQTWDGYSKVPTANTTIPIYKALGIWDEENNEVYEKFRVKPESERKPYA